MDMPLLCHIKTHYATFQFDETPMNKGVYPDTQIEPLLYINITQLYNICIYLYYYIYVFFLFYYYI